MTMKMKRSSHALCNHVTLFVLSPRFIFITLCYYYSVVTSSSSLTSSTTTTKYQQHHQHLDRSRGERVHRRISSQIRRRDHAPPHPNSTTTTTSKTGRAGNQTSMVWIDTPARRDEYRVVVLGYGTGVVGDEGDGRARRTFWRWR